MKIIDILKQTHPAFSFEFFPPKNDAGFETLYKTIEKLKPLNPAYVSVTYGAGGSSRAQTVELVSRIKSEVGIESMAHLTCVGHSAEEIRDVLELLESKGVENVLALRGDPPQGQTEFVKPTNGFEYANELVGFIKKDFSFCIGVAGYPEVHPECADAETDTEHLKNKITQGGEFIVTQLFFDNSYYFDYVKRLRSAGVTVPIIPGIMPILNLKQIIRITEMCKTRIPDSLQAKLEKVQDDDEAVRQIGVEFATEQCADLLQGGAPGIHFYTLNRSNATLAIMEALMKQSQGGP
ncbi:MAG: methylenetetrahydrofolate reductase [NAD(P)H] [Candidatus Nitrohelix vancouverensis]|uniref:Methylenetetrahydrofolate reductase n=1 Tax=Candidatus Nitrohelix vancouverensis TaxID=2705534 RepID=A0A7T0C406_9BACT|nr:MAG: methylenetetrahydrofolate reductase [NAD(P)H] [Candidatus Nitrohelix vancouverensis]